MSKPKKKPPGEAKAVTPGGPHSASFSPPVGSVKVIDVYDNKGEHVQRTPIIEAPPEMSEMWDKDLQAAWETLNENQRHFLKEWYVNGYHGTKAYQEAYKVNDESVARANASRLLANANIYVFRQAIQKYLKPPLERIQEVFVEALEAETPVFGKEGEFIMDLPNHSARMAAGKDLLKMHNLERPSESTINVKVSGAVTVNVTPLAELLNGSDSK